MRALITFIGETDAFGLDPKCTLSVSEVRTLHGRPDLIAVASPLPRRKNQILRSVGSAMASHTGSASLAYLAFKRAATEGELAQILHVTPRSVREAALRLEEAGLVRRDHGYLHTTELTERLAVPMVAFEAKVKLSRRAIFQARQYRSFAHRSVIAIYSDDSIANLRAQGRQNPALGLLAFRSDGRVDIIRRGAQVTPRNRGAYVYALGNLFSKNVVRPSGFVLGRK